MIPKQNRTSKQIQRGRSIDMFTLSILSVRFFELTPQPSMLQQSRASTAI
jgi:hypothetical protein